MKQQFKTIQSLKPSFNLNQTMRQSLDILKLNSSDILDLITEVANNNPLIEYTPPSDMNQLVNDFFSSKKSLKEDLYFQLHTCKYSIDQHVANYIIESLDNNGLITETVFEYSNNLNVKPELIDSTLKILQSFEPLGVFASNPLESICIQLKAKNFTKAHHILITYQKEIINGEYKKISKSENCSLDEIYIYISQIKTCMPYPCQEYQFDPKKIIIPDFSIIIEDENITLIPKDFGQVQIYNNYSKEICSNPDLIKYFNEANIFIDHINKRNKTLLILANILVNLQKSYFLYNDELETCTLQLIAEKSGFHESTVSRTLSNKYFEFQNEIYPVKSLFTSHTKGGTSKDLIIKFIKSSISNELSDHPLTDEQISNELELLGFDVSRRTIAKYRKSLCISNSKKRYQNNK